MHRSRHLILLLTALVPALGWHPRGTAAQQRDVVSSQVEVSGSEASLRLEFADGERLALRFADGVATLDGELLGRYEPGGAPDRAWRDLLADVLSLSDGPLARELERWSPGTGLEGDDLELLARVDAALEDALAGVARSPAAAAPQRSEADPATPAARPTAAPEPPSAPAAPSPPDFARLRDEIREEVRDEVRDEIRRELEHEMTDRGRSSGYSAPRALRAAGDVLGTVFAYLVSGVLALLLMRFAGPRLDSVAREIGYRPGRAAAVGFAGGFLLLPVFVIGIVALAVSLIGIPLLLVWVPLFPLLVGLAAFAGYVGVSHHIGRWVLEHEWPWLDRVDGTRDTHVRLTGLAALLLPFAAGGALGALPLIGWAGGLLEALGSIACLAAVLVGFGAVIITRGGRYATSWSGSTDDELETAAEWAPVDDMDDAHTPREADDAPEADDGPHGREVGDVPGEEQ